MQDTLYVGIDISLKSGSVFVMDPGGKQLDRFSVDNNRSGADTLVRRVRSCLSRASLSTVSFGLEATSVYAEDMLYFLKRDDLLTERACKLFLLNPRQVRKFKDSYSDLPKTDAMDAFVIADCLRFGRIGIREAHMDDLYKSLQRLTRARFCVAQNLTREKNRYLANLFLKFSGMAQEKLFSDNFGATAMALIDKYETVDEIAYTPLEELAAFLNEHGQGKFADPVALAESIRASAKRSYSLPREVVDSVNQVLALSAGLIRFYEKQLAQYDKVIAQHISSIPNPLISIKGVGLVYSAGILSEIGDVHRFPSQASLAKFAGLAWSRYQSGEFDADQTNLIPSGNRYLRYYLVEAANHVRQHDPEYRAFYEAKFREARKTPHKRAAVLTARKFVRLVYALLRDNKLYTPPTD